MAIVLIILGTLSKLFERRHPVYKEGNHVTPVPWLRTTLAVLFTAILLVLLFIKDSNIDFLTYYAFILAPNSISAYFTSCRRSQF